MSFKHRFGADDVVINSDEIAYDGFFQLKKLSLSHQRFDGQASQTFSRELCIRGDAVGVLLYDPRLECFAMVEQIRIGALNRDQSPWLLEIVAGMLDKDGEDKRLTQFVKPCVSSTRSFPVIPKMAPETFQSRSQMELGSDLAASIDFEAFSGSRR